MKLIQLTFHFRYYTFQFLLKSPFGSNFYFKTENIYLSIYFKCVYLIKSCLQLFDISNIYIISGLTRLNCLFPPKLVIFFWFCQVILDRILDIMNSNAVCRPMGPGSRYNSLTITLFAFAFFLAGI